MLFVALKTLLLICQKNTMQKPLHSTDFRLQLASLCSLLFLFGCAPAPKPAQAPVVSPTALEPKPASSANEKNISSEPPTRPEKAPVMVVTPAPIPLGGILPAQTSSIEAIKQAQQQLRKVVVLLPDRPSLAEVNRDIEKGIRAAHQQLPHNPHLQLIVLHDDLSGEALINKAKSYNPDWIIGPLTKSDIQSVQNFASEQQIFLNRLDAPSPALQLGLPAEDEIQQLIEHFKPNQGQIAVITTNDASEQRLLNTLTQHAQAKRIPLINIPVERLNPDLRPWLLKQGGIESSQDRIKRLSQILRADLSETTLQARQDIQAILFLGNAKQLRSIMPSLQYYRVSWPIYATSRLLPSKNTESFNEPELNGTLVLTPPYLVNQTAINGPFEALGWDSYLLLANPQAVSVETQSGKLTNQRGQMRRQLLWRVIQNGQLNKLP